MTYYVSSGTLNSTNSTQLNWLPVGFWLHVKHLHSDSDRYGAGVSRIVIIASSLSIATFTPGHMMLRNMYHGQATCIWIHICQWTRRRIHVARPGYMLTVSRQHIYYSLMSRLTCILCIQQQTGEKLATILWSIQDTMLTATSGYNLYPATCVLVKRSWSVLDWFSINKPNKEQEATLTNLRQKV